jgi:hypothetical protein
LWALRDALMRREHPIPEPSCKGNPVNSIIYIVGLVVVVIFVAGFFGLR